MSAFSGPKLVAISALAACVVTTPLAAAAEDSTGHQTPTNQSTEATSTIGDFLTAQQSTQQNPIAWTECSGYATDRIPGAGTYDCAQVKVPLDYANPHAGTYSLNLLRHHARKPANKKGTLFVNPGGPGEKATDLALAAPAMLGAEVVDSFDVIGIDPRGVGGSHATYCFSSDSERREVLGKTYISHGPHHLGEVKEFTSGNKKLADYCAKNAAALNYVSTSLTARDMDTVRERLGEEKINYLGFSYGSVLGQYYANMFPNRVRAMVIDGVINAAAWAGNPTRASILAARTQQTAGTDRVIRDLLRRCDMAGPQKCAAAPGAANKLDELLQAFSADGSMTLNIGSLDNPQVRTYYRHNIIVDVRNSLYRNNNEDDAIHSFMWLYKKYKANTPMPANAAADSSTTVNTAASTSGKTTASIEFPSPAREALRTARATATNRASYNNYWDAQKHTMCNDQRSLPTVSSAVKQAQQITARGQYASVSWAWWDAACRSGVWSGQAAGSYQGSFNARLANPIMVVGNSGDPATNIDSARHVAAAMPGSRLLTTNSWGHTAYPNSTCAARKIDAYLLSGTAPATDSCTSERQPFDTK